MLTGVTLILAGVTLALLAITMAFILGWANVAFHVEVDEKIAQIDAVLPAANCGGCGYVGCTEYAEAVANGEAELDLCGPGGAACIEAMAKIMGIEAGAAVPLRAVVHCGATKKERLSQLDYAGESTCAGASLVSGIQGCAYGCLGMGDCVRVCDYDAIHVVKGLAIVDYEKCIGCKACVAACPKDLIEMIPFDDEDMLIIACSNKDRAKDVKEACTVGCIGCKACARKNDLIDMKGNLPVINYDNHKEGAPFEMVIDKCPTDSIYFIGKNNDVPALSPPAPEEETKAIEAKDEKKAKADKKPAAKAEKKPAAKAEKKPAAKAEKKSEDKDEKPAKAAKKSEDKDEKPAKAAKKSEAKAEKKPAAKAEKKSEDKDEKPAKAAKKSEAKDKKKPAKAEEKSEDKKAKAEDKKAKAEEKSEAKDETKSASSDA